MTKKSCNACGSNLEPHVFYCGHCSTWQNYRRYLNVSNTTLALVAAVFSTFALAFDSLAPSLQKIFPVKEFVISGSYSSRDQLLSVEVTNWGNVPVQIASNIRCVFGLPNAINHPKNTIEGKEVEFWNRTSRLVQPESVLQLEFEPQFQPFENGTEQIICHSAANYRARNITTEFFLLTIIPAEGAKFWPMEGGMYTSDSAKIDTWYPRKIGD